MASDNDDLLLNLSVNDIDYSVASKFKESTGLSIVMYANNYHGNKSVISKNLKAYFKWLQDELKEKNRGSK